MGDVDERRGLLSPLSKRWVRIAGVTILAVMAAGSIGLSTQLTSLKDDRAALKSDLASARSAASDDAEEIAALTSDRDGLAEDLAAAEKRIDSASDRAENAAARKFAERQRDLDKREGELDEREGLLELREIAVGEAEGRIEANSFDDGVYAVGTDIQPGTYRASPLGECYWAILADANGDDIIANNYAPGPAIASLSAGQFFQSRGCGTWTLSG